MENELEELKYVVMGALLAQGLVLSRLLAHSPQASEEVRRIDPGKFEDALMARPHPERVIQSARKELERIQERLSSLPR